MAASAVTLVHPRPKLSPDEQAMIDALPIDVLTTLTAAEDSTSRNGGAIVSGHRMRVHLFEARDLPATTYFSSDRSDTYAILSLQASKSRVTSKIVRETRTPQYNEVWDFQLSCHPMEDVLHISLRANHSIGRDDFLGRIEVPLSMILSLPTPRKMLSCWFKLLPDSTQYFVNDKRGSVRLGFEYFFDPSDGQLRFLSEQATALVMLDSRTTGVPMMMPAHPQPHLQQPSAMPLPPVHSVAHPPMASVVPSALGTSPVMFPQPPVYPGAMPQWDASRYNGQPPRLLVPVGHPAATVTATRVPPPTPIAGKTLSAPESCPVCCATVPQQALQEHVDAHFRQQQPQQQSQPQSLQHPGSEPALQRTPSALRRDEDMQLQQALRESEEMSKQEIPSSFAPVHIDDSLTHREVQLMDDLRSKLGDSTPSAPPAVASAPLDSEPIFQLPPQTPTAPLGAPAFPGAQASFFYPPQFHAALYPPPGAPRQFPAPGSQPLYPSVPAPLFHVASEQR